MTLRMGILLPKTRKCISSIEKFNFLSDFHLVKNTFVYLFSFKLWMKYDSFLMTNNPAVTTICKFVQLTLTQNRAALFPVKMTLSRMTNKKKIINSTPFQSSFNEKHSGKCFEKIEYVCRVKKWNKKCREGTSFPPWKKATKFGQ